MTAYRKIGKVACTSSRSGETWRGRTDDRPEGVSAAFRELRKPSVGTGGNHTTYRLPGLLATITTMYIATISCARVIVAKKTTIRFFPRVSAYRLLDK